MEKSIKQPGFEAAIEPSGWRPERRPKTIRRVAGGGAWWCGPSESPTTTAIISRLVTGCDPSRYRLPPADRAADRQPALPGHPRISCPHQNGLTRSPPHPTDGARPTPNLGGGCFLRWPLTQHVPKRLVAVIPPILLHATPRLSDGFKGDAAINRLPMSPSPWQL